MLRIYDLAIPVTRLGPGGEGWEAAAQAILGVKKGLSPVRRSLDARKKDRLQYIFTLDLDLGSPQAEKKFLAGHRRLKAEPVKPAVYELPRPQPEAALLHTPPVVVGAGPAGLFAALTLALAGLKPLVLEQGAPVEERRQDVAAFWAGGKLKPYSNVQFGEGGAGTFSDGKLATGIKDPSGRIPFVLQSFVQAGASPEILYDAKPHIGTDVLAVVVKNLRERIISLGGSFCFHTQLWGLQQENGRLTGLLLRQTETGEESLLPAQQLILAPGHSARETFPMLLKAGISMEKKAFAVGLRIQHPQRQIDDIQYGPDHPAGLPPADYKLTAHAGDGRGVYSFCMCPGGRVVNASSEEGRLCVNGMSESRRDSQNANAALIVQVGPEDFGAEDVLAGVRFQRRLEEQAWRLTGGPVPVQLWEDYRQGRASKQLGEVTPQMGGLWQLARLDLAFPPFLRQALLDAMPQFDRRMPGYDRPDALLAGVEARSSSPVRILRDEAGESSLPGLYPCGEGAGYAGGITSAAVDGMKTAEQIIRRYRLP